MHVLIGACQRERTGYSKTVLVKLVTCSTLTFLLRLIFGLVLWD